MFRGSGQYIMPVMFIPPGSHQPALLLSSLPALTHGDGEHTLLGGIWGFVAPFTGRIRRALSKQGIKQRRGDSKQGNSSRSLSENRLS